MIYITKEGNIYTNLHKAISSDRQPGLSIEYKPLTNREYKKARKLDKEKPSDPRSLSSIISKLNERRS